MTHTDKIRSFEMAAALIGWKDSPFVARSIPTAYAGTFPGIEPRPDPDPDPNPEPDPDPDPIPFPLPHPGPDPGFPVDPIPSPAPVTQI